MATEVMSFGSVSKMFSGMMKADQKVIAQRFRLQPDDLHRWMHHLVYVRNLCAHHARLWDRVWAIKPSLPTAPAWQPPHVHNNGRVFVTLLILSYMLQRCMPTAAFVKEWRNRMTAHLNALPNAPNASTLLGFTRDWHKHPFWNF
jgi:abortive infection bacteriophage resistance protein